MKFPYKKKINGNSSSQGLHDIPVKDSNALHQTKQKNIKVDKQKSMTKSSQSKSILEFNTFINRFKHREKTVLDAVDSAQGLTLKELQKLKELIPPKKELDTLIMDPKHRELMPRCRFLLAISEIPNYELKISAMIQQEKFKDELQSICNKLDSLLHGCQFLRETVNLTYFLSFVIYTAKNIIPGSHVGTVKLEEIPTLLDGKPEGDDIPTYFHAVVDVAEIQGQPNFLDFTKKADRLEKLSKVNMKNIETRLQTLCVRVGTLEKQLKSCNDAAFSNFHEFIELVLNGVAKITEKIDMVNVAANGLAEMYSQDVKTFKLSRCFKVFADLFNKIEKVSNENHLREIREIRQVSTSSDQRSTNSGRKLKSTKGRIVTYNTVDKNKTAKKSIGKRSPSANKFVSPYSKQ